ncbi:MAG: A/G-specific adenine glycosylase [Clostridiales bacterium]|nr:A/G-specific adenine glycosylase [Clostridiales bacterium]
MSVIENYFDFISVVRPLLTWYDQNARVLSWRENSSPYRVYLSEIMLQQTRVDAVKPFFDRFIAAIPDFKSLASCDETTLLKLWEGLGYYNRAKNLQKTARIVVEQYNGNLPSSYESLLSLPGIGEYTAGAIASIAFSQKKAAVDGNVLRVFSRLTASYADTKKKDVKNYFREKIELIIPDDRPGDFNQAVMELGATVCTPNGMPKCLLCPLSELCKSFKNGLATELPVKSTKKARRIEKKTVLVLIHNQQAAILKRPERGLLPFMYELPNFDGWLTKDSLSDLLQSFGIHFSSINQLENAKHIFSHVEWHLEGYLVHVTTPSLPEKCFWADIKSINETYPLPSAFRVYRKKLFELY